MSSSRAVPPAVAARRHHRPEITVNDTATPQQQQRQTPIIQTVAVPQGASTETNQSIIYQLTQARLSPPASMPSSSFSQRPNHGATTVTTTNTTTGDDLTSTARRKLVGDFQRLLQTSGKNHDGGGGDGPTLGFSPTPKLAAEHRDVSEQKSTSVKGKIKYQFQVTKLRSWRTGYQRLLVLYEQEFATLDPDTLAVTNKWSYNSLSSWQALKEDDQILLQVEPDQVKLKFTCHAVPRSSVLTALLECQDEAGLAPNRSLVVLDAQRWTRHHTKYQVQLYSKPYGVQEVYQGRPTRTYRYKDIRGISLASGNDAAVLLHFRQPAKSRLFEVYSQRGGRSELVRLVQQNCQTLGLNIGMEPSISVQEWVQQRRSVPIGPIMTSWTVTKTTLRPNPSQGVVRRQLAITSHSLLVERAADAVVSCQRLSNLIALVRHRDSDQITFEFANGSRRVYASPQRDALIVSFLDTSATLGHQIDLSDTFCLAQSLAWQWERDSEVAVSDKGGPKIFAPIAIPLYCLKRVHTVSTRAYAFVAGTLSELSGAEIPPMVVVKEIHGVVEACREFNASVPANSDGLPTASNDKIVSATVGALWGLIHALLTVQVEIDSVDRAGSRAHERRASEDASAVLFASLFRLSRLPAGYQKTAELTTFQESLAQIAGIEDIFAKFWAFRVLGALVIGLPDEKRDRETEFVNKSVVLKIGGNSLARSLVDSLTSSGNGGGSDLMQMVASDLLQSLLCSHYDTTAPEYFGGLIHALTENYRALLATLRSPTPFILENTALLLQVISLNAPQAALKIRDAALSSAIILKYFHGAIFSPVEGYRFLSRYLCSLWFSGPMDCPEKRLLRRMIPHGFLPFLDMPGLSKMEQDQLDELERDAIENNVPESLDGGTQDSGAAGTNTSRLRSRIAVAYTQPSAEEKKPENYRIFFHVLTQDHSLPDLIWSQQTRLELRIALETEIQFMQREIEARGQHNVAWNYQQFSVTYPSLRDEVRVGNIYMRLWLQAGDGFIRSWEDPAGLFELLFRRFLCVVDRDHKVTIMCIRCLQRLYAIHWSRIGPVPDLMILVHSMAKTKSVETQHRLLELVAVLLGVSLNRQTSDEADVPDNAEQLLNSESIGQLCQFAAWGHNTGEQVNSLLNRAVVSQQQYKMITGPDPAATSKSTDLARPFSPPVWFVASSPKIPPPAESIRGPYTISDLQNLVSAGDLSLFDLVTSSHVEDYDEAGDKRSEEQQIDTGKWKRLNEVWQLRWHLCMDKADGEGVLKPAEVALISLKSLARLVELHKSVDSSGIPYIPIPTAKRILSGCDKDISAANDAGANPLSIISQCLLCSDSRVVGIASDLLYKLLQHNQDTMSKLYLSGAFFFALAYAGNNFSLIARLLEFSHLRQNFQSGFKATAGEANSIKDRSILGSMLPDGILYVLVNYGYKKFAHVFTSEADTPEVIWTQEMRAHLVEMIRQHLGDFQLRLLQNNTAQYEFCPIPPMAYKRLQGELFCHNFYLSNLCDEKRFPQWPITEPVNVFKACLERFEEAVEEEEQGGSSTVNEAVKLLELEDGDGDKELRRSYRRLARQFHPDKNPAGMEMFQSIQKSYELLLPLVEGGETIHLDPSDHSKSGFGMGYDSKSTSMDRMRLLIKAQLLICQRCEADMRRLKYPSYHVLLGCLRVPPDFLSACLTNHSPSLVHHWWIKDPHADFVRAAVELVFRTCVISPQNSAEIVNQNGLATLTMLLRVTLNWISVTAEVDTTMGASSIKIFYEIVLYSLRTVSGILFFDEGRKALMASESDFDTLSQLVYDCIEFSKLGDSLQLSLEIKEAALEAVIHLSNDPGCSSVIVEYGILWPLVGCILLFDSSVDLDCSTEAEIKNASTVANNHAKLAVQVLSNVFLSSPYKELDTLFTPPIAGLLRSKRNGEFLRLVSSNVEEAYVIWNASMRSQLRELVREQVATRSKIPGKYSLDDSLSCLNNFRYEALLNEVVIGGVYVRVFNKYGTDALKVVNDVNGFADALITFAKDHVSLEESSDGLGGKDTALLDLSITALKILLESTALGDDFLKCAVELPHLVFSLMRLPTSMYAYSLGCDVGKALSCKQGFADVVSGQRDIWRLMDILSSPESEEKGEEVETAEPDGTGQVKRKICGWFMLEALSAFGPIITLLLDSSSWLELLGILCGYRGFTKGWFSRVGAAKTLSRMLWDLSSSSRIAAVLSCFLPDALIALLKDSPELLVKQFDGDANSPELIWDGEMRSELRSVLSEQLDAVMGSVGEDRSGPFILNPNTHVRYEKLQNEVYVGGIYISRFLRDPKHELRDPIGFLEAVLKQRQVELDKFWPESGLTVSRGSSEIIPHGSHNILHDLTTAAVYVCKVKVHLCDKLASWGYMSRCIECMEKALTREMTGSPLMETVRLLHVAVGRMDNVEALSSIANSDGTHGIVDYTIKAIGGGPLHADAALLVELLHLLFKTAMGSVSNLEVKSKAQIPYHGMAPSPAPGEGSTRRNREKINLGDDPLAMFGLSPSNHAQAVPAAPHVQTRIQQVSGEVQSRSSQFGSTSGQPSPHLHQMYTNPHVSIGYESANNASSVLGGPVHPASTYRHHSNPTDAGITYHQPLQGSNTTDTHTQPSASSINHASQPPLNFHPQHSMVKQQPYQNFSQSIQGGNFDDPLGSSLIPGELRAHESSLQDNLPRESSFSGTRMGNIASHSQYTSAQDARTDLNDMAQYTVAPSSFSSSLPDYRLAGQPSPPLHRTVPPAQVQSAPAHEVVNPSVILNPSIAVQPQQPEMMPQPSHGPFAPPPSAPPPPPPPPPPTPAVVHSAPAVETVGGEGIPKLRMDHSIHGSGIDARSPVDPSVTAEQRALSSDGAPGSANGRVALLHQALACQLCQFLVNDFLENVSLPEIKDPAGGKVHAIALLKLLTKDPGWGMKFKLILAEMPAWSQKYKSQDHSLLLATTKRTDYYLTAGEGDSKPALLLTEGSKEDR